ncbi:hypothetical protein G6F56_013848 [Rhizopus delemar]|nr:hypothetical protein G6F56_013848 [Rhizopus delemar]
MGHIKENCDKRPADSRTCFICRQKGHISYQCTRSQDREPQPHKRSRNREPNSAITSRRIATPKIKKGSKATSSLDLTFGPTAMPPAHDIQSSATTTASKIENTENIPDPNESLMTPMTAFTPPLRDLALILMCQFPVLSLTPLCYPSTPPSQRPLFPPSHLPF